MPKPKNNKYLQTPQAILDLHGFFLTEAEEEVKYFLDEAINKNYRFIRIISGKGQIIKPWLEDYLFFRKLNWRPAKLSDGGEGAFDIRL